MTRKHPTEISETGCVREVTDGRGAYELISPFALERLAKLAEWGKINRGERNWEKGCKFGRCAQSIFRHLMKVMMGEPDEEHDDNLAAIMFWAQVMMHYEEMIKRGLLPASLNDLPDYAPKAEPSEATPGGLEEVVDVCCVPVVGIPPEAVCSRPLRIYVSGPITACSETEYLANCTRAALIGEELERRGHVVFVPHNYRPEGQVHDGSYSSKYDGYLRLDMSIIKLWADSLFFIAPSRGANMELAKAEELGLIVFRSLADVPYVKPAGGSENVSN